MGEKTNNLGLRRCRSVYYNERCVLDIPSDQKNHEENHLGISVGDWEDDIADTVHYEPDTPYRVYEVARMEIYSRDITVVARDQFEAFDIASRAEAEEGRIVSFGSTTYIEVCEGKEWLKGVSDSSREILAHISDSGEER